MTGFKPVVLAYLLRALSEVKVVILFKVCWLAHFSLCAMELIWLTHQQDNMRLSKQEHAEIKKKLHRGNVMDLVLSWRGWRELENYISKLIRGVIII